MTEKQGKLVSYGIAAFIAVGSAVGVSAYRGAFGACELSDRMGYFSDGCFVPGVILTGIGLLILVSSTGFFDILGYAASSLWHFFTPFGGSKPKLSFYDYKVMKSEGHEKQRAVSPVLICGICLLALSVLFLILYNAL